MHNHNLSLSDAFWNIDLNHVPSYVIREAYNSFESIPNNSKGISKLREKALELFESKKSSLDFQYITESSVSFSNENDARIFQKVAEKLGIPVQNGKNALTYNILDSKMKEDQKQMLPFIVSDVNGTISEEQARFVRFLKTCTELEDKAEYRFANGKTVRILPEQARKIIHYFDNTTFSKQRKLMESFFVNGDTKALRTIVEGYKILPPIDPERHPVRPGLEGPFRMKSGAVLYYDSREGKYYDASKDMYLDNDEIDAHINPKFGIKENEQKPQEKPRGMSKAARAADIEQSDREYIIRKKERQLKKNQRLQ